VGPLVHPADRGGQDEEPLVRVGRAPRIVAVPTSVMSELHYMYLLDFTR
jgi:hypothetical protein